MTDDAETATTQVVAEPIAALADDLRSRGFTESLVRARYQTSAIHAARVAQGAGRHRSANPPPKPLTATNPIATLLALLVEGLAIERKVFCALGALAERLQANKIVVTQDNGTVTASYALLPINGRIICAPWNELPDDSSFHLLGCLPRGRDQDATWLDVGTGSGFVPLLAPPRPTLGTDVSKAALAALRIGIALNRRTNFEVRELDLLAGLEKTTFDLISFNAPIDGHQQLLARFWPLAITHLKDGGEILVHSVIGPARPPADGQVSQALYTPERHDTQFGITRYRPWMPRSFSSHRVDLSATNPHLDRDQLA